MWLEITPNYFELNTNEVLTHAHVAFGDTIQVISTLCTAPLAHVHGHVLKLH